VTGKVKIAGSRRRFGRRQAIERMEKQAKSQGGVKKGRREDNIRGKSKKKRHPIRIAAKHLHP